MEGGKFIQSSERPAEKENYTLAAAVIVLLQGIAICFFYQDKHHHQLDGLQKVLEFQFWGMGILTAVYAFIRATTVIDPGFRETKTRLLQFLCIVAILVVATGLRTVVRMPKAACVADPAVLSRLAPAFADSCKTFIDRLPVDNKDDQHREVMKAAREDRKIALERAIAAVKIDTECRACYAYLLDSLHTDTLSVWCAALDTLNLIRSEWLALQRSGDIGGISAFLTRHRLGRARILQSINHQFMIVDQHASGFLKDAIQLDRPVSLEPVRNGSDDDPDPSGAHIDFVLSI